MVSTFTMPRRPLNVPWENVKVSWLLKRRKAWQDQDITDPEHKHRGCIVLDMDAIPTAGDPVLVRAATGWKAEPFQDISKIAGREYYMVHAITWLAIL